MCHVRHVQAIAYVVMPDTYFYALDSVTEYRYIKAGSCHEGWHERSGLDPLVEL